MSNISELREHLLGTLSSLRDRENPMDPARARAVAEVASVLVDTAKVEVEYLKATGQDRNDFLEQPAQIEGEVRPGLAHTPFGRVHRLQG